MFKVQKFLQQTIFRQGLCQKFALFVKMSVCETNIITSHTNKLEFDFW